MVLRPAAASDSNKKPHRYNPGTVSSRQHHLLYSESSDEDGKVLLRHQLYSECYDKDGNVSLRRVEAEDSVNLFEDDDAKDYDKKEKVDQETKVEKDQCIICLNQEKIIVLIPCFHLVYCNECCEILKTKKMLETCSICKTKIQASKRIFK